MGNKELLKRRRNDIDKMKISAELASQLKEIFHRCVSPAVSMPGSHVSDPPPTG